MTKKLISILVAAMMILSIIPAAAFASGGTRLSSPATEKLSSPATEKSIVSWNFEEDPAATGWTFDDADGDGYNWTWYANGAIANSGTHTITSSSYYDSVALTPDNWAISPVFAVPEEGAVVTFQVRNDMDYYPETFGVYVIPEGGAPIAIAEDQTAPGESWVEMSFEITEACGQNASIAIRHYNCTNMYKFYIDDVEIAASESEPPVDPTEPPITEPPADPTVIDTVEVIGFDMPVIGGYPDHDVSVPDGAHYSLSKVEWHSMNKAVIGPDYEIVAGNYYVVFEFVPDEGYEFGPVYETTMLINGSGDLVGATLFCYSFAQLYHMETANILVSENDPTEPPVTEPPVTEPPAEEYTLDEALNAEGGEIHFESEGDYPWVVVNDEESGRLYAMSGNEGVHSSDSVLTATITANAGDVVTFEFQAWGEGTSTYWDYCEFSIDGERVGYWGAYQNEEWEAFTSAPMTAGEHTLTWKYHKDTSVNKPGDCFMVDNVEITEGELPPSGILGDVDLDGDVDTADALMALRYAMGLIDLNEDQLAQAEVTGEGSVSVVDSLLILRKAMELIDSFPAE